MKKKTLPQTGQEWMAEVARAFKDAQEAIPFTIFTGQILTDHDLFHLAPVVCLKFRGYQLEGRRLKVATEAALASYVATTEARPEIESKPHVAFAYCYLASHYGLGLVTENTANAAMTYIEANEGTLWRRIIA